MGRAMREARPVLDGSKLKWTLEREQSELHRWVRVDWLRFTLPVGAVVSLCHGLDPELTGVDLLDRRGRELTRQVRAVCSEGAGRTAEAVSREAARMVAALLGEGVEVGASDSRGMDFYSARTELVLHGAGVGWVLAGGRSSRQADTVHVNVFGWSSHPGSQECLPKLADLIRSACGWITRCDLAWDAFTGGRIEDVRSAWLGGEFDMRGHRPKQAEAGSWTAGHSRTYYVGSRDTGKYFRAYEKGHQLFGPESGDQWIRYEVEFRNNYRVIDPEILTHPAEYFAGAYPFCAAILARAGEVAQAKKLVTGKQVADKTVEANVQRLVKWVSRSAMPAVAAVFEHGGDLLGDLCVREGWRVPRRLKGFARSEVAAVFEKVAAGIAATVARPCSAA